MVFAEPDLLYVRHDRKGGVYWHCLYTSRLTNTSRLTLLNLKLRQRALDSVRSLQVTSLSSLLRTIMCRFIRVRLRLWRLDSGGAGCDESINADELQLEGPVVVV